jgi:membrane protease YdiL (CAAX protease family)
LPNPLARSVEGGQVLWEHLRVHDELEKSARLSAASLLALHLLPGVAQVTAYALLAPTLAEQGIPYSLAFTLAVVFVSLPFMLVVLRMSHRWGGILYRERMPVWLYATLYVAGLALAFALLLATAPLSESLATNVFNWLPAYLLPDGQPPVPPARKLVLFALILKLIVDGVVAPVIEELYFRGVLLPRMETFGAWGPALNALLFSLQHFWQPYNWPLIFLINLPLVYVARWRRNLYIGMLLHCSTNTIGAVLGLVAFFDS